MMWVMAFLTFVGGILNVVQSGCNAEMNRVLAQPLVAALLISAVSCLTYLALMPAFGLHAPETKTLSQVPWWAWLGGLCGAGSILCTIFFAGRLGSGVFTALVVTASLITSVVLDHYGIVGFAERPMTFLRVIGCVVMLAGLSLITLY